MTIALDRRVSAGADVMIQELQGESVLLNVRTGKYFGLDDVGTQMWQALTAASSLQSAHARLLHQYDVEEGQLRQDLLEFVTKLVDNGLVEVHGE